MKYISITITLTLVALAGVQAVPAPASLVNIGPIDSTAKIPIDIIVDKINVLRR
ncbi:hypothetical protein BGZ52_007700, partial [Haplosporangium bisporale]